MFRGRLIEKYYRRWGPKRRDNAQQAQLDQAIADMKPALGPDVVCLTYTLGQDWTGDNAIFFRIVLSDRASRRDELHKATEQMEEASPRTFGTMGRSPLFQLSQPSRASRASGSALGMSHGLRRRPA